MAKRQPPLIVAIPTELDSDVFSQAWHRWIEYRSQRKCPLAPMTRQAQLKQLATMGVHDAVRSIEQSIERGWQGLFPVEGKPGRNVPAKPSSGKYGGLALKVEEGTR